MCLFGWNIEFQVDRIQTEPAVMYPAITAHEIEACAVPKHRCGGWMPANGSEYSGHLSGNASCIAASGSRESNG